MARLKGVDRIAAAKAELAAAKDRVAQIEAEEAARLGKLAVKAGLLELEISEADLVKEFEAIAGRFRGKQGKQARTASTEPSAG